MTETYIPEHKILSPYDSTIVSSDDWPIYTINQAEVFSADTKSFTSADHISLLNADAQTPLVVSGKLFVPKIHARARLLPKSNQEQEYIQLDNVRQWAYGQYDDGKIDIWAAGAAGWYLFKPAKAYWSTFDGMTEAVQLLYYSADMYTNKSPTNGQKPKHKGTVLSAEDLFAAYAETFDLSRSGIVAEGIYRRHHRFMITSMVAGKEGVEWKKTDLYRWMERSYPDVMKDAIMNFRKPPIKIKSIAKRKRESTCEEERPAKRVARASSITSFDSTNSRTRSERNDRSKQRISRLLTGSMAPNIASRSAVKSGSTMTSDNEELDHERTVRNAQIAGKGHKGKSALRPLPSKFLAKDVQSNDRRRMSIMSEKATGPQVNSSEPRQRPSRTTTISNWQQSVRRRSNLKVRTSTTTTTEIFNDSMVSGVDGGVNDYDDDYDDDDDDDNASIRSEIMVAQIPNRTTPVQIRLMEKHFQPTGIGDIWTCPLDGCIHKIYAASDANSQRLIKDHYRYHVDSEDTESRIELVRKLKPPGFSTNRLLERIRSFGVPQPGYPLPIIRKY